MILGPGVSVVEIFVGKWCKQPCLTIDAAAFVVDFHKEMQPKAYAAMLRDVAEAMGQGISVNDVDSEPVAEHRMIWGDGTVRTGETYPFCSTVL